MNDKIILAGNGHGAIAAFQSLCKYFKEIYVLTDDESLVKYLRAVDKRITGFSESDVRYVVCAGYQKLIDRGVLEQKTVINTHPSLLPKYRGMHSVVWAMLNNESEIGFTIHLVNERMDDGDIIGQYSITYRNQTSKEIMDDFDRYVIEKLGKTVCDFIDGKIKAVPQNRQFATWVPKRNLDDCLLNFEMPNWQLNLLFKALVSPYPLPRIRVNNRLYEITHQRLVDVDYYTTTGRVVNIEGDAVYIKVKDGLLVINGILDVETQQAAKPSGIFKIGMRL